MLHFVQLISLKSVGAPVSANVSAVHDVPEPGEARRRHVRRPNDANLLGVTSGGKAARTRGRCVK
jgi:hypothetical protein